MSTNAKKIRDFTEGPILSQIVRFTIPLILTSIMQLLFSTADTIVVGRWGGDTPEACEHALAAVGSCGSVINLLTLLLVNLSLGVGVSVAQDIGAKKYDEVHRTVQTAVSISFITSAILMVVGFIFARPLLILMGTDPAVLDQAIPYMFAYFCGLPAKILYNYCSAALRSAGETTRPLIYLFAAGVLNVGLNLVMILVFHMGALGVGIATAASFWLTAILILIHMTRTDAPYRIELRKLFIDGEKLKKILRIGIPAGLQGMVFSVSHVLIQSSINSLGTAVVAGNTAAANLEGYIYSPMNCFYQATVTFVGQHKGAKKYQRMKKCILCCMICVTVVGATLGWLMVAIAPYLLGAYTPGDAAAIEAGMTRMWVCTSVYFLCGLMEVGSGIMRGLGRSTTSMVTSLFGSVAFRIVWILVVFAQIPTLPVLYLSYTIGWILTSAAHYTLSALALRHEMRSLPEAA